MKFKPDELLYNYAIFAFQEFKPDCTFSIFKLFLNGQKL